jgi:hypothetical protein
MVTARLAIPQTDVAEGTNRDQSAVGKVDRGLLDIDHPIGGVPTAEI